jgi:hypothetical protein
MRLRSSMFWKALRRQASPRRRCAAPRKEPEAPAAAVLHQHLAIAQRPRLVEGLHHGVVLGGVGVEVAQRPAPRLRVREAELLERALVRVDDLVVAAPDYEERQGSRFDEAAQLRFVLAQHPLVILALPQEPARDADRDEEDREREDQHANEEQVLRGAQGLAERLGELVLVRQDALVQPVDLVERLARAGFA